MKTLKIESVDEEKVNEIKEILRKEKIKHIYLNFVDFYGNIRTKMVGVKELINNTHVSWFNGISINGSLVKDFENNKDSDWLVIIPDPNSFRRIPFIQEEDQKSAMLMCYIKNFELDTRKKLLDATNEIISKGYCPIAGTELIYGCEEKEESQDFYYTLATSKRTKFNNKLVNSLLDSGIDIEYYMPYGKNHSRIDLVPDIVINSADKIETAKWFANNLSNEMNYKINFNNIKEKNISTCPVHLSIWKENREQNLFFDINDEIELSNLGRKFINGILYFNKFIKATIASTTKNEILNYETRYSTQRDSSLMQVPLYFKEKLKKDRIGWSKRTVYQGINADCNHYLVFSALLYAGIYGIENNIEKIENRLDNYTIEELIIEVKTNQYFKQKFGDAIIKKILENLKNKM